MALEQRLHARCGCAIAHAAGESQESGLRPFALATSIRHFERDRPFAVEHLALDLELDLPKKRVSGAATLTLKRIDAEATEIVLDAIGFEITSVTLGKASAKKDAAYVYDGRTLTVAIPPGTDDGMLAVSYAATPRRGLYFLEPDAHVPDRPRQVWSQCQEEDARHWIPCHDKPHVKMTTEMRIRIPNGFYVLSNGELVEKKTPAEGSWWFHWKMPAPHPSYLLTLVAGEFEELTAKAGEVPLQYLVPKGRSKDGERTFARTPEMIRYFSQKTGVPYPWNKYAQVVVSDFIFGGMENTTATTMYEYILLDDRAAIDVTSDDLIAHELAHQWFGDFVTCRDWSEGWLNEGFATFMEHVWREKHLGQDEYDYGVKNDLDAYMSEAHGRYRRPIVCQDYDAPLDLFDRHLYEKGGLVLHMLRLDLGDEVFWRAIKLYLSRFARSVVETRDLQRAMEEVSGRSLGRFFEQWIYKPGHPELEVDVKWDKKVLTVTVKQTQGTADGVPATFEVPLRIELFDADGKSTREKLSITQKTETFTLPIDERPLFIVVDPEMRILGDVQLKMPNDMLRAQLVKAPSARGRWLATHALAKSDDPVTIAALVARLDDQAEFWAVRAEAADALGTIRARECELALTAALTTKHPKVRRAVVSALGRFKTHAAVEALRPLALHDESYLVEAEAARALGKTKQPLAYDTLLDVIDRHSWADVIRVGAIDGLAALRDDRAAPHLLARTRYGHPTRARRAAILALPKLLADRKGREALEDLLEDPDPHLRVDVTRALGELGDVKSRGALRARLDVDLDPRVRRRLRETLRDLGGDSKRAVDQVREDLDKMGQEQSDLKARLAQIEAKLGDKSGSNGVSKVVPVSKVQKKNGASTARHAPVAKSKKR